MLVLIALALITAGAVFFMANVGRERRGTDQYARGSEARHLADTAVNIVMGQINAATKEGTTVAPISWASQPGMIRTYGQDGQLSRAYKLYSWDNLVEDKSSFDPNATAELPPAGWSTLPAQYTDLNAPIKGAYPIADPTIANDAATNSALISGSTVPAWDFTGEFAVDSASQSYHPVTTGNTGANPLPMPVKWLYVLQDGSWVTPMGSGNTVTVSGATTVNPIVGRIAFWTDDETSKVNINTASEGSFWDTPKAATQDEMQFAANPPAKGEFQRLNGHPATTSLSAVFPEMRANGFSRWNSAGSGANTTYLQEMQDFFKLVPRIDWSSSSSTTTKQWGGSQAGTFPAPYTQTYAPPASIAPKNDAVVLDTDRLYTTPDELWFQPLAASNGTSNVRPANNAFADAPTALTAAQMVQRAFLFTANSRAPETTLFETPRISLWPMTWPYNKTTYYVSGHRTTPAASYLTPSPANLAGNPWVTPQEQLLAFCSTIDQSGATPRPYYFQRQNPDSPTDDWSNIQRNQDLVGYLRREMGQPFPGMGAGLALSTRWGAGNSDWIALNCFDYSRSLINQYTYNQTYNSKSDYLYTYTGLQVTSGVLNNGTSPGRHIEPNAYTVAPLHVPLNGTTYTTEGAFPALKEAALVFYASARNEPVAPTAAADVPDPRKWQHLITYGTGLAGGDKSQTTEMRAVMLLSFSGMNPGVWSYRGQSYFNPVFWVKVSRAPGASSFQVNGSDINLPAAGALGNVVQYSTTRGFTTTRDADITQDYLSSVGCSLYNVAYPSGVSPTGVPKTFRTRTESSGTWNTAGNWSLISDPIGSGVISGDQTTFDFTGSKIQVDIYAPLNGDITADPTQTPGQLISSQQIDFGAWSSTATGRTPLPIPLAPRWNVKQAASVKMPTQNYSGTGSMASVNGWQTEIVPLIDMLINQSTTGTNDPRIVTASYTPIPAAATFNTEPLIYAYTDNNGVLQSTNFQNRVLAITARYAPTGYAATSFNPAEGGGLDLFNNYGQPAMPTQSYQLVTPYDTVISMVTDPTLGGTAGDARLMGRGAKTSSLEDGSTTFISIDMAVHKVLSTAAPLHVVKNTGMYARSTDQWQHHTLNTVPGIRFPTGYWLDYQFDDGPGNATHTYNEIGLRGLYTDKNVSPGYLLGRDKGDAVVGVDTDETNTLNATWDWTSLPGNFADGGYLTRPDQEYQVMSANNTNGAGLLRVPYFNDAGLVTNLSGGNQSLNVFTPNRQVPSPVILGTLPVDQKTGWQTLNFCPNPASAMNITNGTHPGLGTKASPTATGAPYSKLPDHLLLDLFWMPVAEPYPISDQLSTAGKINLNYAMMPFPYIQRKTGLDAVLKSVWLAALLSPKNATTFAKYYKSYALLDYNGRLDQTHTRFPVNVEATLKAFDYKFSQGDIFRSASQICDMFLYPNDPTATANQLLADVSGDTPPSTSKITTWWAGKSLTADNVREDPYNAIYSRITTKSNTYTVHWKVQSLQKRPGSSPATWTEYQDTVSSELRGSTLIERYIDPNATDLPDYATDTSSTVQTLSQFYKWRTVSENYFQP